MKKWALLFLPLMVVLASCTKEQVVLPPVDESAWLQKERGFVAFSDFGCDWFAVQTNNGYTLMRSWSGAPPMAGSTLYGDFHGFGVNTFYNRSGGYLIRAEIRRSWLSYFEVQDELNFRCNSRWP